MTEKRKLLLIDDDESVLDVLRTKLSGTDRYDVFAIREGRRAVAVATTEKPDLILCDIDMPEMSGGQVGFELSKSPATREIPMLFLSSLVRRNETGNVGGWDMVSKAITFDELVTKVDQLLS